MKHKILGLILIVWVLSLLSIEKPLDSKIERYIGELNIVQGNTLGSKYNPVYWPIIPQVLGNIIGCEGNWNPEAQNPYSTAYGMCQIIDGTWDYIQKKWNMELDRNSEYDQLYACERLYEEEGTGHWEASEHCWNI